MAVGLDKFNEELVRYCKGEGIVADEAVFDLGVKYGRYLEQNKIQEQRLDYFAELDKRRSVGDEIQAVRKKVDQIVSAVITTAVKEQITENGDWEVGYGSYYSDYSKLNEGIEAKYSLQTLSVDQPDRHGDFSVTFGFVGEVRQMFIDCEISPSIDIGVTNNSGDESQAIRNVEDVDDALYGIGINFYSQNDGKALENVTALYDKLSKQYLFLMLSL
jgi:hypothetical protein